MARNASVAPSERSPRDGAVPIAVLVVDDSPVIRKVVADMLRQAGYSAEEAAGGAEALERLQASAYDAVVTDLHMPQPDGFALIETIQQLESPPPVVVLTGSHAKDVDAAARALRLGAQDFLTKPLARPEILLMALERLIERKREREATRWAEARYRELFDNAPIGLFRIGSDWRLLDANEALVQLVGYPDRKTLIGQEVQSLDADPGANAPIREALARDGVVFGAEVRLRRFDGRTVWASVSARASLDTPSGALAYEGSVEDISYRKETEERLREAQKLEAVGRLAGGLAHEFNSLLGVILGTLSLIERDPEVEATLGKELSRVRRAGERAARLTRQLLAFSRAQLLQPREVDLSAVVRRLAVVLGPLAGPSINLRLKLSAEPVPVRVDPGEMEQVIVNLVTNACDAMPGGGELTLSTEASVLQAGAPAHGLAAGAYAVLSVVDTGIGMDAATRLRVFEPFFTTKGRTKASGLGLSAALGIVTQSAGQIDIESAPGLGTQVRVYLPLLANPAAEAEGTS